MFTRLVSAAYQYARQQLTSFNASALELPSDETMEKMTTLFRRIAGAFADDDDDDIRPDVDDVGDVDEQLVIRTLEQIPETEDVLQVVDDRDKYNLMQKAIIWDKMAIVEALLARGSCCDNVGGGGSGGSDGSGSDPTTSLEDVNRPLHLACYLGRSAMVALLLRFGADPTRRSSLSLAAPSGPERLVPTLFKALQPPRSPPKEMAFHFAVCGDHVEVLQLLFSWERAMLLTSITGGETAAPLFVACKAGARRCLLYMIEETYAAAIVNATNDEGFTPLHYAVQRGKWFVEKLLQHGASVSATNRFGQNVLHRLFAVDGKLPPDFYAVTQLLLDVGIHREINCPDRHGYTPLLLLLHHLNSCWNAEDEGAESNKDVKKCVELMLNYGADPNIQCSTGHSALHVILHRNLFRYSSLVALAGVRTDVSGIQVIHDILRLLIEKGAADVNLRLKDGLTTPLLTWIFSLQTCNISPEELSILREPFLSSLDLLLSNGADPNARPAFALSPLSSMVSWCQIWMSRGQASSLLSALPVVEEILSRLFRRNARILSVVRVDDRHTFYNTYQAILSMCLSIVDSQHLVIVSRLTSHLMLWGLQTELYLPPHFFDEDVDDAAAGAADTPMNHSIKRHVLYQYLKIGFHFGRLVNSGGPGYENCLRFFCNFTETTTMHSCFRTALRTFEESTRNGGGGGIAAAPAAAGGGEVGGAVVVDASGESKERMITLVLDYLSNAESLKVLARKTIIKSLNGKIPLKVNQLELPNSLKEYIVDLAAT